MDDSIVVLVVVVFVSGRASTFATMHSAITISRRRRRCVCNLRVLIIRAFDALFVAALRIVKRLIEIARFTCAPNGPLYDDNVDHNAPAVLNQCSSLSAAAWLTCNHSARPHYYMNLSSVWTWTAASTAAN